MGGAQPLAATMNGAVFLGIDVDESRIDKRLATGYCDRKTHSPRRGAATGSRGARARRRALSVGLVGNAADVAARARAARRHARRAHRSDERARHAQRLRPDGHVARRRPRRCASRDPAEYVARERRRRSSRTCRRCSRCSERGAVTFDYGNNIRTVAFDAGVDGRVRHSRLRAGVHPSAVLRGEGAVPLGRAVGRSDGHRIAPTSWCSSSFPHDAHLRRWITLARERVHFQGLPARICWLGQGERAEFGVALNDLVASGELTAPIVIGRDHLDTGSVASPFRETEAMKDGSDAVADWPILNALLNTASGAIWVSFHHGGGVGIGNSLHAGQVIVADGTPEMRVRLERVLTNDPGIGVARHADAGYEIAIETARSDGIKLPMRSRSRSSQRASRTDARLLALQALARPAVPRRSTRGYGAAHAGPRAFRGHHALQRAVRLLRLLEDDRPRRSDARAQDLRRRGAVLQSDARHVHRRRADCCGAISRSSSPPSTRDAPQVHHADHARRRC